MVNVSQQSPTVPLLLPAHQVKLFVPQTAAAKNPLPNALLSIIALALIQFGARTALVSLQPPIALQPSLVQLAILYVLMAPV